MPDPKIPDDPDIPQRNLSFSEVADRRLDFVDTLFAEQGFPHHPFKNRRGPADGEVPVSAGSRVPFRSAELVLLAQELISRFRQLEREVTTSGYRIDPPMRLFPVYRDGGVHPDGFVLAPVGQDVAPRLFPCTYPADIVDFGLTCFRTHGDRVRFFSELTRIYSDAVRLSGEIVGVRTQLMSTLSKIAGVLSNLVCASRLDEAGNPEPKSSASTQEPSNSSDPGEHIGHTASTPTGSVAASNSAPAAGSPAKNAPAAGGLQAQERPEA